MVEDVLARLVAFPSVVGTPNDPIIGWIADHCRSNGARVHVLPGPEGDRANLFATIGPVDASGYFCPATRTSCPPARMAGVPTLSCCAVKASGSSAGARPT